MTSSPRKGWNVVVRAIWHALTRKTRSDAARERIKNRSRRFRDSYRRGQSAFSPSPPSPSLFYLFLFRRVSRCISRDWRSASPTRQRHYRFAWLYDLMRAYSSPPFNFFSTMFQLFFYLLSLVFFDVVSLASMCHDGRSARVRLSNSSGYLVHPRKITRVSRFFEFIMTIGFWCGNMLRWRGREGTTLGFS